MNRKSNLLQHLGLKLLVASPWWKQIVATSPQRAVGLFWLYKTGRRLDLEHPTTLNEKIQWLKIHGPIAQWTRLADKLAAKEVLASQGLEAYLPATIGEWKTADDIDFDSLPESFAIKCNHDCGSTNLVTAKSSLSIADRNRLRTDLQRRLNQPYGYRTAEPHYLGIERRIMAEQLIETPDYFASHNSLTDYKFWCFNGRAEVCLVCYNRNIGHRHAVKDLYALRPWRPYRQGLAPDFRSQPFVDQEPPIMLDDMIALAERLSKGHPQVRVDLYQARGRIFLGELTFTASSGIMRTLSDEEQRRLGEMVDLNIIR